MSIYNSKSNAYNAAVITPVLAAGSTASPYYYQVNISQRLCSPSCGELTPVFNPEFSVKSISNVGTGQYVATIHVEGLISFVPCGGTPCCTKSQLLSQDFTLPFASTTAPTSVNVSDGTTVNAVALSACQSCSRNFVSETPLTLTIATT